MKRVMRLSSALLSLCLAFLLAFPVCASESQKIQASDVATYRIRLFSGIQGTINRDSVPAGDNNKVSDDGKVWEQTMSGNERINFSRRNVTISDTSKYYIKGFRVSGRDIDDEDYVQLFNSQGVTDEELSSAKQDIFTVSGDMDFIVSYGVLTKAVSYKIYYRDTAGNELAPSETYYGNVGDKPVVAHLYIAGYQPQAYNMTKTLEEDESKNVFVFTYTRIAAGGGGGTTEEDEGTTTTPAPPAPGAPGTPVAPAAGGGAAAGAAGAGGAGGGAAAGVPGEGEGAGPGGVEVPDEETPLAEPEELQDLDEVPDDEVPLANMFGGDARLLGIPVPALIAASLALMGGIAYFVILKKRKKKEVEEEEES